MSPDTDVLILLAQYCKDIHLSVLFNTGVGIKRGLPKVNNIGQNMGKRYAVIHCFTGCDTTNVFVSQKGLVPIKLIENLSPLVHLHSKPGRERENYSSVT